MKILIVKLSSMGDIVLSTIVLDPLKEIYPKAEISFATLSNYQGLLKYDPRISTVIPVKYNLKSIRKLKKNNYDIVIDLQGLFRSNFIAILPKAKLTIGRSRFPIFNYTYPLRLKKDVHAAELYLSMLEPLDKIGLLKTKKYVPKLYPSNDSNKWEEFKKKWGLDQGKYIVLAHSSRWRTKNYPISHWKRFINLILEKTNWQIVLIGSRKEMKRADSILADSAILKSGKVINLTGKLNIEELIMVINGSDVYVGGDTGPMHIAAALNKKVVSIFGPTNPRRTGPYTQKAIVIQKNLPCVPCYSRICMRHHKCMRKVSPTEVFEAFLKITSFNLR